MSDDILVLIIVGGYAMVALIITLVWIFVKPEDDLEDICLFGLLWPLALVLLSLFLPFKLLEMLQNKLLERRSKKKYYDEDEYRNENEDWYDDEYGSAYLEANYKDDDNNIFLRKR